MASRALLLGISAAILIVVSPDLQAQTGAYDIDIGGNGNTNSNVTQASGVFTSAGPNASLSLATLQSVLTPGSGFGGTAKVQTGAGGGGAGDLRLQVDLLSNGDNASLELRAARDVALNANLSLFGSQSALLIVAGRNITSSGFLSTQNNHGAPYSGTLTLQAGGAITLGTVTSAVGAPQGSGGNIVLQASGGDVLATSLSSGSGGFSSGGPAGSITVAASAGAINVGAIYAASSGTNFSTSGGAVSLAASGNVTTGDIRTFSRAATSGLAGDVTISSSTGNIAVNGEIDASTGYPSFTSAKVTLTTGPGGSLTVGAIKTGAITLTADAMTFNGGANSIANVVPRPILSDPLTIQTATASRDIRLGGATVAGANALQLTETNLAALAPGFSQINVGASGRSGTITVDAAGASFKSDVRFYQRLGAEGAVDIVTGKTATFSAQVTGTGPRAAFTGGGNFVLADRFTPNNTANGVGAFLVTGNLSFNSPTVLELTLDGASLGQYDRLEISGALALNGTLEVALGNGFNPAAGEVFQVLTFGSATGDFASLDLPALVDGLSWQVSRDAGAYTLGVVPEPTTVSLVTLFGVALAAGTVWAQRRRKRAAALNTR